MTEGFNAMAHRAEIAEARLAKLQRRINEKMAQVEHYRDFQCQMDHAKAIAEGRVVQCRQILFWMDEDAASVSPAFR